MAVTAPLLQMEGISKAFPGVRALEEASLTVGRGEVHAVMGQNGAGKSTLIKILTGAYRRDAGTVSLDGRPSTSTPPSRPRRVGSAPSTRRSTWSGSGRWPRTSSSAASRAASA